MGFAPKRWAAQRDLHAKYLRFRRNRISDIKNATSDFRRTTASAAIPDHSELDKIAA